MRNIDFDRLRRDLADDRYAAAFAGVPEMVMEAWDIESLGERELLELAERERVDLRKYEPEQRRLHDDVHTRP